VTESTTTPPPLPAYRSPSFRALQHRNFRLFIVGQFVSLCGTWMQSVALGWLVLELSDSPLKVGLVTTIGALPVLLFTLYGGVVAGRVNKRRALILLQSLFLVEALILGTLTALRYITVPWVYLLALFSGLVSAFEIPIRQSYLVELVGKTDLMNAIALNSSAFNLSRVLGPAFAGGLIAVAGTAACFFVNAVSFFAVLGGLLLIRGPLGQSPAERRAEFRDGLRHVFGSHWPRALVVMTTVFTLFGASLLAILPVFARDVLGTKAGGYGALTSGFGIGAAVGALSIAAFGVRTERERLALAAGLALGGALVALGLSRHFTLAFALLVLAGLCMAVNAIMTNTILQTSAPDHLRGQVLGLYSFIVIGMAPFGSLQAGWLAERFGASTAIALGGAVCLTVAGIIGWRMLGPKARGLGTGEPVSNLEARSPDPGGGGMEEGP